MKILCVADHIDPLVYSEKIKERFKDVHFVLGAGDLPIEYYSYIVSCLNVSLLFIFGNHNLSKLQQFQRKEVLPNKLMIEENFRHQTASGATYVEDRQKKIQNVLVMGLGGSMRYNSGDHQYTELQMYLRILHILPVLMWNRVIHGRWVDILLTHAPPRGIHDKDDMCHKGFKAFLSFMSWFKPKYLVHGHIHLYELNDVRKTIYKKTQVVNCYDHIVLEYS